MLEIHAGPHDIRIGEDFAVSFQRTLRIPDDGRTYPLPPGLGAFPIYDAAKYPDDLARETPDLESEDRGSYRRVAKSFFIPMYQREALWFGFRGAAWRPNAVTINVGGVNAVSGRVDAFGDRGDMLSDFPQNYIVVPLQPWLDGFNTGDGTIRQFVAMPLGMGYSMAAALTDNERLGHMRITVFDPRSGWFPDKPPRDLPVGKQPMAALGGKGSSRMGLGAGGVMHQRIYPDPHGLDAWDAGNSASFAVHIVNSRQFSDIVGEKPPPSPVNAAAYTRAGLPWFNLYDDDSGDIPKSARLAQAKTIHERDAELGINGDGDPLDIVEDQVKPIDGRGTALRPSGIGRKKPSP